VETPLSIEEEEEQYDDALADLETIAEGLGADELDMDNLQNILEEMDDISAPKRSRFV